MSHQDPSRSQQGRSQVVVAEFQADQLKQSLERLLGEGDWGAIRFRDDCTWGPRQLAATALLWAWSDELTLGDRFFAARRLAQFLFAPQQEFASSVQAFMKLLLRWTVLLVGVLQVTFRRQMQRAFPTLWRVHGLVLFGIDGSRVDVPRSKSHEAAHAPVRDGKGRKLKRNRRQKPRTAIHSRKASVPQMWLTLLFHVGTGLPWSWRIGPTGSSEREHWLAMLDELPSNALITADAGFVGYDCLRAVVNSGRHFLVRVGSNVRLLYKLGFSREVVGTVYLWPDRAARRSQPPLVLRLVVATGGKYPVYLLTSVGEEELSRGQVLDVYRRRWGVELFFRHLKQTYQRRKLRSTNAAHARLELEWSLLGLWSMALDAQVQATRVQLDPTQLSLAGVWRTYRRLMRDYRHPLARQQSLPHQLPQAVRDTYERANKSSRNYPRKKRPDPPAGSPEFLLATKSQIHRARYLTTAA
ncbi:Transposase DDE domain protein [Anatilimnocola aggregata]|uniref:Transposase DDE domain protein n=1 Tax=Anatilimnocola aggregata TaxID=2528021 RepID=A0A517YDE7_9BACT|nr:transposase [Anatilimnocola aggregata]QDU28256.1 Transposase DDE domain protein [Anatilimnocola aggregata]QDU29321.1 Transposase DDE domain protein [Anatilimnocola aggregata]